jgi:hypothetical protein
LSAENSFLPTNETMFRLVGNSKSLEAIFDVLLETIVDFDFSSFLGFLLNQI